MKKLWIAGIILAVIIATLVILVLNLGAIVNRNKDALISRAEDTLGREITIGEIGVTIWRGLGIRLDDFTIADDPAFSDEPFVRAKSLQVDVQILPLLRKELKVKRITLNDPVIRVIRNESGAINAGARPIVAPPADTPNAGPATVAQPAPFAISLVNISGGDLTYIDRAKGLELRITRIDSRVQGVELARPVAFEVEAAIFGDEANLRLEGTFGPVGEPLSQGSVPVDVSFAFKNIAVESLTDAFAAAKSAIPTDVSIDGPVSVEGTVFGTLSNLDVTLKADGTAMVVTRTEKFNKPAGTPLLLSADATLGGETLAIKESALRFHQLQASVAGTYTMTDPPVADLRIRTEPVSLAGWENFLPATAGLGLSGTMRFAGAIQGEMIPGTPPRITGTAVLDDAGAQPPQTLKPITGTHGRIELLGDGAKIDDLSLTIGATKLNATARVESFEPLHVKYEATSPAITLDDFRPPNPKAKKPEVLKNASVSGAIEGERNTGTLKSSGGSVANIDYQNLSGKYTIVDKEAKLSDVHMQTLDGTIDGAGTMILDKEAPSFAFDAKVRGVNVIQLFDMIPGSARNLVSGKVNLDVSAKGTGKEWESIQKTIDGNGLAELLDGAVLEFNVLKNVIDELAQRTGQQQWISQNVVDKYPKAFKDPDTKFRNMKSDFAIEGGRLKARNLTLDAGDYGMLGKGSIGFDKTVDLNVTMKLSSALSKDLMADVREAKYLANAQGLIEVPFVLKGTLPKVTPAIDSNFIGEVIQRALLQKGGDTIQKKILDGIFGGKKGSAPADTTKPQG